MRGVYRRFHMYPVVRGVVRWPCPSILESGDATPLFATSVVVTRCCSKKAWGPTPSISEYQLSPSPSMRRQFLDDLLKDERIVEIAAVGATAIQAYIRSHVLVGDPAREKRGTTQFVAVC